MKKILLFLLCLLINVSIYKAEEVSPYTYISVNQHADGYESNDKLGNTKISKAKYELIDSSNKTIMTYSTKGYRYKMPNGIYTLKGSGESIGYHKETFLPLTLEITDKCPNIDVEIIKKPIYSDFTITFKDQVSHHIYLFDHLDHTVVYEPNVTNIFNKKLIYDDYKITIDGIYYEKYIMSEKNDLLIDNDIFKIEGKILPVDKKMQVIVNKRCKKEEPLIIETTDKVETNDKQINLEPIIKMDKEEVSVEPIIKEEIMLEPIIKNDNLLKEDIITVQENLPNIENSKISKNKKVGFSNNEFNNINIVEPITEKVIDFSSINESSDYEEEEDKSNYIIVKSSLLILILLLFAYKIYQKSQNC